MKLECISLLSCKLSGFQQNPSNFEGRGSSIWYLCQIYTKHSIIDVRRSFRYACNCLLLSPQVDDQKPIHNIFRFSYGITVKTYPFGPRQHVRRIRQTFKFLHNKTINQFVRHKTFWDSRCIFILKLSFTLKLVFFHWSTVAKIPYSQKVLVYQGLQSFTLFLFWEKNYYERHVLIILSKDGILMYIYVSIWQSLFMMCDLVPFVQFKKPEKHSWRNFTESNTPPWVIFTFFELYKWYQIVNCTNGPKSREASSLLAIICSFQVSYL